LVKVEAAEAAGPGAGMDYKHSWSFKSFGVDGMKWGVGKVMEM
jgi:hypothetical protein